MISAIQDYSRALTTKVSSLAYDVASSSVVNKISNVTVRIINVGSWIFPYFISPYNKMRLIPGSTAYDSMSWCAEQFKQKILPWTILQDISSLGVRSWWNLPIIGFPFSTTVKVICVGLLFQGSLEIAGPKMVRSLPGPWGYFTSLFFGKSKWVEQLIKSGFDVNQSCPQYGGWTPLHFASAADFQSNPESLELLLKAGANVHSSDFEGNTPLHLASDEHTVQLLLAHGADIHRLNHKGQTPLHTACSHTNLPGIILMLVAGADPKARDLEGSTPLYLICKMSSPDTYLRRQTISALIENGSDPYLVMPNTDLSPLRYANYDMVLFRLLTKTVNFRCFDSCKNIHDICDLLFPPSKQDLPLNWEEIISKVPKSSNLIALEREEQLQQQKRLPVFHTSRAYLPAIFENETPAVIVQNDLSETVLNALKSKPITFLRVHPNPLIKLAWKLLNRTAKLSIEEVSDKDFIRYGLTLFSPGRGASYNSKFHKIMINRNHPQKMVSILFECMNGLQRNSFEKLHQLAASGDINRENFTILIEWIEYQSLVWQCKIISAIGIKVEDADFRKHDTFAKSWILANLPRRSGFASHAEIYRKEWDIYYSAAYFGKHPEFIRSRGAMLSHNANSREKASNNLQVRVDLRV